MTYYVVFKETYFINLVHIISITSNKFFLELNYLLTYSYLLKMSIIQILTFDK